MVHACNGRVGVSTEPQTHFIPFGLTISIKTPTQRCSTYLLLENSCVGVLKLVQILIADCDVSSLYEPGAILDSQTTDSQWADNLNLGESPSQYATQDHQVPIKEEVDESQTLADAQGYISFTITLYVNNVI